MKIIIDPSEVMDLVTQLLDIAKQDPQEPVEVEIPDSIDPEDIDLEEFYVFDDQLQET